MKWWVRVTWKSEVQFIRRPVEVKSDLPGIQRVCPPTKCCNYRSLLKTSIKTFGLKKKKKNPSKCWHKAAKWMDVGSFQSRLPHCGKSSVPGNRLTRHHWQVWQMPAHQEAQRNCEPWTGTGWAMRNGLLEETATDLPCRKAEVRSGQEVCPLSGGHMGTRKVLRLKTWLTENLNCSDSKERENVYSLEWFYSEQMAT